MSVPNVAILDYGSGNIRSAERALMAAGAEVLITSNHADLLAADGVVLPGVGAFDACAKALRSVGGDQVIDTRLAGGLPVLAICVGMQILFTSGIEHGITTEGLSQWPGEVTELNAPIVPHMGWNTVETSSSSHLFQGIRDERFYFVHSYAAKTWELPPSERMAPPILTWSHHGERFLSAVENGALSATQFHPEKSGAAGISLLRNWFNTFSSRGK
ncbi:MAG: imidazole glycerol phosphate synthase subunit HisH [Actinobacteria bacterium]|nr:imidazole glycerol phosphate synthase subunit HisH [Actinomycetota bacterium]